MKVALFGGSFNPIHNGHLAIAKKLVRKEIVDQVWFIPCGKHAFGKKLLPPKERFKMISLAIKDNPSLKVFDVEFKKGTSYTSETVLWFKQNFYHDFYEVIGADILADIDKWHNFEYLKKAVKFIVIERQGYTKDIRKYMHVAHILKITNNISSTKVREKIGKRESIKRLVPRAVREYILKGGLYGEK